MVRATTLKILMLALLLPLGSSLKAEVRHDDDYVWRRARGLSSGQQVLSFQTSYQNFGRRFSDNGRVQPLGKAYARELSWDRLLLAADVGATEEVRRYMRDNRLSGNDIAATATYEVDRQEIGFGLNWSYGLTQSWMVGVAVPVRFVTTRTRENLQVDGTMTPAMREKLKQLADAELDRDGFNQVPLQKQTWEIGDVSLLSQFEVARINDWTWSLQQQVRFPTARSRSVAEYISFAEDQGSINVGVSSLLDYQFRGGVAGLRGGYVAQFADTVRMRGPIGHGSSVDAHAGRDLGDWVWGAVDGEVRVGRRVGLNLEHSFLAKARDRYAGDVFSDEVYNRIADQSDQQLHQTRVGVLYKIGGSTGTKLGERWMASVDFTYPWRGKNSAEAARTSFELINYF